MLRGQNIIVFSSADWKVNLTSPEHISTNFAQQNKVLFIETFGSRTPSLQPDHIKRVARRIINWFKGIRKQNFNQGALYIYSPITLAINFRPFLFVSRLIFLSMLRRLIKKIELKNPILYFYLPPPMGIIENLQNKIIVYHCVDEWSAFAGGENKIFMDSERMLVENADLVLVTNKLLYEKKKPYARRIYKIYHGVDYEHFAKEFSYDISFPEDIENIPKPIIGIVGTFADWMDLDLIKLIAQRHKEWSIVSIGLIESNVDISGFAVMGNIYFLGQKSYSELPNYYRAIDVFIVPFILTEHIKYCSPIRLYEHLSSGKPIITTDFPAAHEVGEGLINIASDKDDFVKKLELALNENDKSLPEKRKALAKRNTWKSKTEQISEIIDKIVRNDI